MANNKPNDPARYLDAYTHSELHCFLPQSNLDAFCEVVERTIQDDLKKHLGTFRLLEESLGKSEYEDETEECYARKDELRDIASAERQACEGVQRLQLLDELRIVSIYRSIEIERARVLADKFPDIEQGKAYQVTYLRKTLSFWHDVFGLREVEELRIINNCIKHSGKVSRQLASHHNFWSKREGSRFHNYGVSDATVPDRPLRDTYERLAPYVGAYWNHFIELSGQYSEEPQRKPIDEKSLLAGISIRRED